MTSTQLKYGVTNELTKLWQQILTDVFFFRLDWTLICHHIRLATLESTRASQHFPHPEESETVLHQTSQLDPYALPLPPFANGFFFFDN